MGGGEQRSVRLLVSVGSEERETSSHFPLQEEKCVERNGNHAVSRYCYLNKTDIRRLGFVLKQRRTSPRPAEPPAPEQVKRKAGSKLLENTARFSDHLCNQTLQDLGSFCVFGLQFISIRRFPSPRKLNLCHNWPPQRGGG